jgi:hypothetical protein
MHKIKDNGRTYKKSKKLYVWFRPFYFIRIAGYRETIPSRISRFIKRMVHK